VKQNHIIHKVLIEIAVENKEKAYVIKDNINSFLTVDVFPKLEKYITTLQNTLPDHTIQISRLTLELNEREVLLNTALKNNIVALFKEELTATIKPSLKPENNKENDKENDAQISFFNEEDKLLKTFIHFLEKGYMPWWNSNENGINILENKVFEKIILAKNFENKIASIIQKPSVKERIINQLTDDQIKQLCVLIIKNKSVKINLETNVIKQLPKLTLIDRNAIWSLIITILGEYVNNFNTNLEEYALQQMAKTIPLLKMTPDTSSEEQNWKEIRKLFPFIKQDQASVSVKNRLQVKEQEQDSVNAKNRTSKNNQEETQKSIKTDPFLANDENIDNNNPLDEDSGYHVQNAGLVLIHPFMTPLFKHCNLINPKTQELINPELCVHLLHYIATGKTNQPESDMLFEKFLCNIPLNQSISRHIKLSNKHKAQAKKLIEAVQQNWSAMKTASVELLQNEFFQRSGKLVLNDNNYTITVERKTQDILLDKLSWGIGFIRLPWQNQFIYVNW
jgi:hypothetical protein